MKLERVQGARIRIVAQVGLIGPEELRLVGSAILAALGLVVGAGVAIVERGILR